MIKLISRKELKKIKKKEKEIKKKLDKSTIDVTVDSYLKAYSLYGDIWEDYNEDYSNSITDFFIHSLPEGSLILDQGCGTGYLLLRCTLVGHILEGFDISPEAIKICKNRLIENSIDPSFFKLWFQDIRAFNYPKKHYNGIIDYYTLHHFPKFLQKDIIQNIYLALKPAGLFLLGMFSKSQFPNNNPSIIYSEDGGVSVPSKSGRRFFYLWEVPLLESFLESIGFRIILTYRGIKHRLCEILCEKPENK